MFYAIVLITCYFSYIGKVIVQYICFVILWKTSFWLEHVSKIGKLVKAVIFPT